MVGQGGRGRAGQMGSSGRQENGADHQPFDQEHAQRIGAILVQNFVGVLSRAGQGGVPIQGGQWRGRAGGAGQVLSSGKRQENGADHRAVEQAQAQGICDILDQDLIGVLSKDGRGTAEWRGREACQSVKSTRPIKEKVEG